METNPTIGDQPDTGKVIEFRVPENWVPTSLRAPRPKQTSAVRESRQRNAEPPDPEPARYDGPSTITQADLEKLEKLRGSYAETRKAFEEHRDFVHWALMNGAHVEPGPLSARVALINRQCVRKPGVSYYQLIVR